MTIPEDNLWEIGDTRKWRVARPAIFSFPATKLWVPLDKSEGGEVKSQGHPPLIEGYLVS
jgi:hypothetical protein